MPLTLRSGFAIGIAFGLAVAGAPSCSSTSGGSGTGGGGMGGGGNAAVGYVNAYAAAACARAVRFKELAAASQAECITYVSKTFDGLPSIVRGFQVFDP